MITEQDLEIFGYYDMVDAYPTESPKSVQEMVTEYKKTAGQPLDQTYKDLMEDSSPLKMCWDLIREEYEELDEQTQQEMGVEDHKALKEFADLTYVLYGYCAMVGWDLDEAVRRVHKNNMERMYQDDGTIKRREDGKIIKNPNTPKVNLEDLV